MEEKTPVGSNAPIEESTEKKTSPAGSSSASPAPAGSSSPSAAPIAESAGAAEAASTDASTKSADAGEESAPAGSSSLAILGTERVCNRFYTPSWLWVCTGPVHAPEYTKSGRPQGICRFRFLSDPLRGHKSRASFPAVRAICVQAQPGAAILWRSPELRGYALVFHPRTALGEKMNSEK